MGHEGIPRYIQNIISWLGSPEKHIYKDNCKNGSEFRSKKVDIPINWNAQWIEFKERSKWIIKPENMKTLFAVDCSNSITDNKLYSVNCTN